MVITYGLYEWKREKLGYANIILATVIVVLATIIGYRAELALGGEMSYGSGDTMLFVIGGSLALSRR